MSNLDKIRAITAQGIAYAKTHEIKIISEKEAESKIAQILLDAKSATKRSWQVYETFKNKISAVAVNSDQYETAIYGLTKILNI